MLDRQLREEYMRVAGEKAAAKKAADAAAAS